MAIPIRFIKTGSTVTGLAEFQTGETIDPIWLPPSVAGSNMLINTGIPINQDGFAGGALAADVYGYDMWKAGGGGCNMSINSTTGVFTHSSGNLVQVVESPLLAWGQPLTFSVEDPSTTITVTVGGTLGSITAGAGRRGVTLTPTGSGDMTVQITATSATYSRPKLERGTSATAYVPRSLAEELALCQWYFTLIRNSGGAPFATCAVRTTTQAIAPLGFKQMRTMPATSHTGGLTAVVAGAPIVASAVTAAPASSAYMYLALTLSGVTPGQAGYIYANPGNDSVIRLNSRL
ncbi:hypothetical protein [Xanthomonas phage DES1]|nr:hypothetical protein [Xanthomonas phage DES1]